MTKPLEAWAVVYEFRSVTDEWKTGVYTCHTKQIIEDQAQYKSIDPSIRNIRIVKLREVQDGE